MGGLTLAVTAAVLAWKPQRQNVAEKALCLSTGVAQLPAIPPLLHYLLYLLLQARALPRRQHPPLSGAEHTEVPASVCHPLVFSSGVSFSAGSPLSEKRGR